MRNKKVHNVFISGEKMMATDKWKDDAIAWHVRLSHSDVSPSDWESFTSWLETDPANADAYDDVVRTDASLKETMQILRDDAAKAHNDNELQPTKWHQARPLFALAATAVFALLAFLLWPTSYDLQLYTTRPGETREIILSDRSQIAMNGGTELEVDRRSNRFVRLLAGEALFNIRHDVTNPFTVETPESTLRDLGTVFNVRHDHGRLDVQVSQGSVLYNPRSEAMTVTAGNRLKMGGDLRSPVIAKADRGAFAGWIQGRLTYQNAQLDEIAVDLTRSLGTKVIVAPTLVQRHFTGVIQIDKDQDRFFLRLEGLLGVRARHSADGWQLTS
jgi:transmembrane sensor